VKENFDKCFALIIQDEGGYVNDPRDPGGRTNLGVTQRNWETYLNRNVTETEMRKLTPSDVKTFYKVMYWDKLKGDQLPAGVDYAAFDLAVNSGVSRAARYLQQIAGATQDGVIGPKSLEAIAACDPAQTVDALCDMRLEFLKRLSTFDRFGKGWQTRVAGVKAEATRMS
jgi:lysozyme family protein